MYGFSDEQIAVSFVIEFYYFSYQVRHPQLPCRHFSYVKQRSIFVRKN